MGIDEHAGCVVNAPTAGV